MKFPVFIIKLVVFLLFFAIIDFASARFILEGLNTFYGFNKSPEVLVNGSSMSLSGFHRVEIEKKAKQKVSIYAKEGVSIEDRYTMLQQFFLENNGSVKTVIYEVNPLLFSDQLTAANVYTIFYPFMDNSTIDKYIRLRAKPLDYYAHKYIRASRFDALTINFVIKGYTKNYDNFKTNSINAETEYFSKQEFGKKMIEFNKNKMEVFEKTMQLLQNHNTKIVLVMMPIYYQKMLTFDSTSFNQMNIFFRQYVASNKNSYFIDLNTEEFSQKANLFSDVLHLNRNGQIKVTEKIVNFLND